MSKWIPAKVKPPVEFDRTEIIDAENMEILKIFQSREYLVQDKYGHLAVCYCLHGKVFDTSGENEVAVREDWSWTSPFQFDCDYDYIVAYMELPEKYKEKN